MGQGITGPRRTYEGCDPHFRWLAAALGLIIVTYIGIVVRQHSPACLTETDYEHIKRVTNRALAMSGAQITVMVGDVGPIVCDLHPE